MGATRRRLAAGKLGSLPGCRSPRQEDPPARGATRGFVVDLRACHRRAVFEGRNHARTLFTSLADAIAKSKNPPFDFAVVDETQDITVSHLKFFAALGAGRPNAIFFAGDLGQRIFQQPFSWKALGVDIRGRSRTLRVNYRTSHQIRMQADRLLGLEVSDVDGNTEKRSDTVSVFNGPPPTIRTFKTQDEEIKAVGAWLAELTRAGVLPHEIGVFVRSPAERDRAVAAAEAARIPFKILDEHVETVSGHLSISTMHLAKGLEFRAVAVMACDDEVDTLAGAHRDCRRRRRSAGGLRHGTPPTLRRLYSGQGSPDRDKRRTWVGVLRRPTDGAWVALARFSFVDG